MTIQLTLRAMIALLVAMATAVATGLIAWGPIGPGPHQFADSRTLAGIPGALNVLTSLLPLLASVRGAMALRHARWPAELARPWRLFFIASASASLLAVIYHLRPDDDGLVLVHMLMSAAFTTLLCGFLAERVHGGFGSRGACIAALVLPSVAALHAALWQASHGTADMRALLLLQLLPALLLPAGGLGLPGRGATSGGEWLAVLSLYVVARICESADVQIYAATGWISGHSLMHIVLAAAVGVIAYRAVAAGPTSSPIAGASRSRMASASTLAS